MRAADPMPTVRTLLRWCLGAVFVALGVIELFCPFTAVDARAILLAGLKIIVGLVIAAGTLSNLRQIRRFFAGNWRSRLKKAIKSS